MKNRWLIALSAIGIHICIGSVYAWSVLTKPIMQAMGFTLKETTWTFSIAILFLGLSAGFLGDYVEKYGPRKSGLTSTCFFGLGMFGTALALHLNSLPLLYLFYGVIGGIGLSHTAVDITGSDIQCGDIASVDISPLMVNPRIERIYK